jgi:hypothetical protein
MSLFIWSWWWLQPPPLALPAPLEHINSLDAVGVVLGRGVFLGEAWSTHACDASIPSARTKDPKIGGKTCAGERCVGGVHIEKGLWQWKSR